MSVFEVYSRFHFSPKLNPLLDFWTKNTMCHFDLQAMHISYTWYFQHFQSRSKRHVGFWSKVKIGANFKDGHDTK